MEWISIKDRLPEVGVKLLLAWRYAWYSSSKEPSFHFGIWDGKCFHGLNSNQPFATPDYWSIIEPLPEPPKDVI
jgi:hypothetical protein